MFPPCPTESYWQRVVLRKQLGTHDCWAQTNSQESEDRDRAGGAESTLESLKELSCRLWETGLWRWSFSLLAFSALVNYQAEKENIFLGVIYFLIKFALCKVLNFSMVSDSGFSELANILENYYLYIFGGFLAHENYCCCSSTPTLCPALQLHGLQHALSFTISWSLLRLMSIQLMMPFNYLICCCPLLFLPSVFPSIGGLFQ